MRKCPVAYSDSDTKLILIEHALRIKVDDRTAKRHLIVKVNATKDGQSKLIATHSLELALKNCEQ